MGEGPWRGDLAGILVYTALFFTTSMHICQRLVIIISRLLSKRGLHWIFLTGRGGNSMVCKVSFLGS
jgi:hypothetical protein